ncbi:hypothetical protein HNR42_001077 [Deinobacterium chartae]|uniref:DUF4139 domain-containing protein n=1 Tax=Deinobacterium chartae TaxID=521158 RepID=A0A841HZN6_9DEIO|nr:hypothetical protein [Deinobacterium chartae]MBB6097660.1 hypothetical protein [Deinobacterium chartae]
MKRLLLGFLLMASAQAAELRIYPGFTEYRESVPAAAGDYVVRLNQEQAAHLIPGTLNLEGPAVLQVIQQQREVWLNSLEGKTVFLRDGEKVRPVELVRAEDLTVRDPATGRFFNVSYDRLEFPELPPAPEERSMVQWNFKVDRPVPAQVSYLTRAYAWNPRYTLEVGAQDSSARLSAFADIRNVTSRDVRVDKSELVAGEVNVEAANVYKGGVAMFESQDRAAPAAAPMPSIASGVEGSGVYRFAITEAFDLPARSTVSLPFLNPQVTLERFVGTTRGFNPRSSKGKLDRMYRLRSDVLLPAGVVTVRDEGVLVGQTSIPDTAAREERVFGLGEDPDVSYNREVKVLSQTKDSARYQITLTLENAKKRALRVEYKENFSGNVTLEGQAQRTAEGLSIEANLPAGGKLTRSYTLTFQYR